MSDELTRIQKKIQKQEQKLPAEWILTHYKAELRRSGAQARGTQANYLKALRKILVKETQLQLEQIKEMNSEELLELNKEIADNIQNSKYRSSDGEDGKRRKREYWSSWKNMLETLGHSTDPYQKHMPKVEWIGNKKDKDPVTRPDEIPNRDQIKKFVEKLGEKSRGHVALRNQALALFLWDKGPRIGEVVGTGQSRGIRLKDVSVNGSQVQIHISGNKKSSDRTVPVYQGRKTLKDWIQKHPYRGNSEAYLFPVLQKEKPETQLNPQSSLSTKFHSCASDLDFKTWNEPFHIFRKGMVSSHFINGWASWEKICKWHGKKNDSTKPDYLKLLMEDVNRSVGENMGVDPEAIPESSDDSMKAPPLKPVKCPGCDYLNRCIREVCSGCGTELPESSMPDNLETDKEDVVDLDLSAKIGARMAQNPDKTLNEIKQEVMEKHGN
jgi:site-specific recombinase XerC